MTAEGRNAWQQVAKWLLPLFAAALCGCGSYRGQQIFVVGPEHVKAGDPLGASFVVKGKVSYDQVWQAALSAMSRGMTVIESHKPSGVIKSRVGNAPSGKIVGLFISPTSPQADRYQVDTVSVRPIGLNSLNGKGWDPEVIDNFNAALGAK